MLQEGMNNYVVMYALLGLGGLGIVMEFLLGIKYTLFVKDTSRMGNEKSTWLDMLKKKYEICYKLEMNVHNVDNFVDKYIRKQKMCGMYLYTWESICGKLCIVGTGFSVISVVAAAYAQCGQTVIFRYGAVAIVESTLLITGYLLAGLSKKKEVIHMYVCEYLENIYAVRLAKEKQNPKLMEQYRKEMQKLESNLTSKNKKKRKNPKQAQREEIERMKQELVAELKQERLENEKKRLLEKQQEEKRKENLEKQEHSEEKTEAVKQSETKAVKEKEKKENKENNEQILQDILREYLGELNG